MSPRKILTFALAIFAALVLAACSSTQVASQPTAVPEGTPDTLVVDWLLYGTPTATPTLEPTARAARETEIALTLTVLPNTPSGVTATPTGNTSGAAPVAAGPGDAARGQQVFTGVGTCFSCHDTATGNTLVGPSLKGIASRAGSRIPGESAQQYLHDHIVNPNNFVPQGFNPGVMPADFGTRLSAQQINDLVAYLMTLQ
ncbi:MAG TPA: c-type cytochrome [Aggregatilineales bacterium]|nr:c-type cytochrome [Aggregatilineales bacterium]